MTNKEGLGPSEVAKNQKRNKKNKKQKKTNKKKTKSKKNTTIPKKKNFSVISQKLPFFLGGGCPKIAFFDNLAQKTPPPKHYKIGVSAHQFLKNGYASRNGHFWTKNPNS